MNYPLIGILGGTFNPIHHGHLRMAQELADNLNMQEVRFIPSANPPHKPAPKVSAEQRAEMVQLAIQNNPLFKLDKLELARTGPSYTIDTLESLFHQNEENALCLIMGTDAFLSLDTWHRWNELMKYCHIILVQRPANQQQVALNQTLTTFLEEHYTEDLSSLNIQRSGFISMQKITALTISSSLIRELINSKKSIHYLTPSGVEKYIHKHHLYL